MTLHGTLHQSEATGLRRRLWMAGLALPLVRQTARCKLAEKRGSIELAEVHRPSSSRAPRDPWSKPAAVGVPALDPDPKLHPAHCWLVPTWPAWAGPASSASSPTPAFAPTSAPVARLVPAPHAVAPPVDACWRHRRRLPTPHAVAALAPRLRLGAAPTSAAAGRRPPRRGSHPNSGSKRGGCGNERFGPLVGIPPLPGYWRQRTRSVFHLTYSSVGVCCSHGAIVGLTSSRTEIGLARLRRPG